MSTAEDHRQLGLRINQEIWNEQRFERITRYFTEDFVRLLALQQVGRIPDPAGFVEKSWR